MDTAEKTDGENLVSKGGRIRICVDADGGDDAPKAVTDGVLLALSEDPDLDIVLVGREESIRGVANEFPDRIEPVVTTEVIEMGDHPAKAVRSKKDSSIVVGCKLVHDGRADGFFSAGSTGACLTAATILIGRIKGVSRPALVTVVPGSKRPVVFLDCGANSDCKPEYLLQFAHMGMAFSSTLMGVEDPKVGLLNNGSEETKGSEFARETHGLLKEKIPNSFIGNVEGRDLMSGSCDVIVSDGFTGNVTLKVIEGTALLIYGGLKEVMTSSFLNKLAAAKLLPGLKEMRKKLDPDVYGGAPLLGIKSPCIVGHGSSNAEAVKNGIITAVKCVRANLVQVIDDALEK
ncbi:MAG: phosphate acyltransferase PlsX [Coriobacteriales bacterium]|jgi:glycerol-3-phosphate acyltransferase PlsX